MTRFDNYFLFFLLWFWTLIYSHLHKHIRKIPSTKDVFRYGLCGKHWIMFFPFWKVSSGFLSILGKTSFGKSGFHFMVSFLFQSVKIFLHLLLIDLKKQYLIALLNGYCLEEDGKWCIVTLASFYGILAEMWRQAVTKYDFFSVQFFQFRQGK